MKNKSSFKGLMLLVALLSCISVLIYAPAIFAEEVSTLPCQVVTNIEGYGNAECSVTEGNVGDVVKINVSPYVFCKLASVKANGVDLTPNENGEYSFALIEGENIISVTFIFDEEQVGTLAGYMNQAKEEGIESLFTMENLFNLISWVISLLMGSGFLITWIKTKTIKSATSESVKTDCINATNNAVSTSLGEFWNDKMIPTLNSIGVKLANMEEVCQTLARCMVLAQENTPESRLAIIEELTKLKNSSVDLAAAVKSLIAMEVQNKEEEEKAKKEAILELEKANEAIEVKESTENSIEIEKNQEITAENY